MCSVAIAVSSLISRVSSAAATTQLTDTGAALVAGAGDISAPALLRHKISLNTGTVIVLCGDSIEVPTCGRAKISHRVRRLHKGQPTDVLHQQQHPVYD